MQRVRSLTPLVEQVSIDEAFLDVSDLAETGEQIARELQARIRDELGLPCSIGVASNKLLAKIANDVGKAARRGNAPPCAITAVPEGREAEFLAALPVESLWGVGPKTGARLRELGLETIGHLAQCPEKDLYRLFGKNGSDLAMHARGIDDSPIITSHELKSISQETTFAHDIRDEKILKSTLLGLSEQVGKRLRESGMSGVTIKIKIRWSDFTTLTRQMTLDMPVDLDQPIYQAANELFMKVWKHGQPVRLLGVGVSGLDRPARQLSLWEFHNDQSQKYDSEREKRLQIAIDQVREKFGDGILHRGGKH